MKKKITNPRQVNQTTPHYIKHLLVIKLLISFIRKERTNIKTQKCTTNLI